MSDNEFDRLREWEINSNLLGLNEVTAIDEIIQRQEKERGHPYSKTQLTLNPWKMSHKGGTKHAKRTYSGILSHCCKC